MPDCPRLGKRVKSATCADGCVTAASAANRQAKIRGRRIRPRCNPSFPIPLLRKARSRADSPTSRPNPIRMMCRSLSPWPRRAAGKSRNSGVTVTAVAAVVAEATVRKDQNNQQQHSFRPNQRRKLQHALPRFLIRVVQPAKAPRLKRLAKPPNWQPSPDNPPSGQRARLCSR